MLSRRVMRRFTSVFRVCGGTLSLVTVAAGAFAATEGTPPPPESSTDTIVVQGQKFSVESRIDRKIYSVPEEAQTELGTLSDILSEIPSIDVDPDGVVS